VENAGPGERVAGSLENSGCEKLGMWITWRLLKNTGSRGKHRIWWKTRDPRWKTRGFEEEPKTKTMFVN